MKKWGRDELILALLLYCETSFGRIHQRNPEIIKLAECLDRTPSAVAMKMSNFASFDPTIDRAGLGNVSKIDQEVWNEFYDNWEAAIQYGYEIGRRIGYAFFNEERHVVSESDQTLGLDKLDSVKIRIGQNFFRKSVLSNYNKACCITGFDDPKFLVASHIVPWSVRQEARLNPSNGLCLSVLHDRAFDTGNITIDHQLCLKLSSRIKNSTSDFVGYNFLGYEGKKISLPEKFLPAFDYLEYHRNHIFLP